MPSSGIELARFAVDCDVSIDSAHPHQLAEACSAAAAQMHEEGFAIRFLRCVHLPEQDSCVLLLDASSSAVAEEAARRGTGAVQRAVQLGR